MGYEQPPEALYNESDKALIEAYGKNIEYGIGIVKVPLGIAGPSYQWYSCQRRLHDSAGNHRYAAGGAAR